VTEARRAPPYDPLRSRLLLAGGLLGVGLGLELLAGAPVRAVPFYGLVGTWLVVAVAIFRWGSLGDGPVRILLLGAEMIAAGAAGWLLGAGPWLAMILVVFPVLEWNLRRPGAMGLVAGAVGGGAVGLLVGVPPPEGGLGIAPGASVGSLGAAAAGALAGCVLIAGVAALAGSVARARRDAEASDAGSGGEELERSHADLRAAYEELRSAQAELVGQAKLATLGQLVSGVAHEINTPLGALSSNHDTTRRALEKLQVILEDEKVTPDELGEVRRIVKAVDGVQKTSAMAVERMMHIVKSLRSFGRPDRSEVDRVDLHEGIDSTLEIVDHEIGDEIRLVKEYGDLPPVQCLPHQLNQVFMNLILNGAQAIDGEGTITIATEHRAGDESVAVRVSDTGAGIAPEDREHIFEPGFTTKGARMGMGLGLLITRQIVDRHGGRIEVESEVGEGTTFTVVLPLELPEGAVAEGGRRARPQIEHSGAQTL